jgi:uncharacterized protein (DUF433 family)
MSIMDAKILAQFEQLSATRRQQLLDYATQQVEAQHAQKRL